MKILIIISVLGIAFLESSCTDVCGCSPVPLKSPEYNAFVTNGTGHSVKVRTYRYDSYNFDTVKVIPELSFEIKADSQKQFMTYAQSSRFLTYPFTGDSVVFEFDDAKVLSFRGTLDWTKRNQFFSHTWKYSPMADSAFTISRVSPNEYYGYHTLSDSLYLLAK
jgi:hypothetical protein